MCAQAKRAQPPRGPRDDSERYRGHVHTTDDDHTTTNHHQQTIHGQRSQVRYPRVPWRLSFASFCFRFTQLVGNRHAMIATGQPSILSQLSVGSIREPNRVFVPRFARYTVKVEDLKGYWYIVRKIYGSLSFTFFP